MKVILKERVPALGNVGEVVTVSSGYGRNYLIPKKFAIIADEGNKKELENERRRLKKKVDEERKHFEEIKKKVDGISLTFEKRVGANGKLFGTVTTLELSQELAKKGVEVERRLLSVEKPIKSLGEFTVKAKLFSEVEAYFKVKVVIDPAQVEELKAKEVEAKKAKKLAQEQAALDKAAEKEEGEAESSGDEGAKEHSVQEV